MTVRAIRWSDHDRYFGPLTYAHETRYRKVAIMLGSGDNDDYPGCRLRVSFGAHTFILALPAIIKPWREWRDVTTEPARSQFIARGRKPGYHETHEREYGFTASDGSLHIHYGQQTHEWPGTKSKTYFYPWREHRCIRHSIYAPDGAHFADLPQGPYSSNRWAAERALKDACPVTRFAFRDFDGEEIVATCQIEEREWRRGKGVFRLLFLGRNKVARDMDLRFSSEVGKRKGSWKGGTVGHSCEIAAGETPESAFGRYCKKEGLTFVGPATAPVAAAQPGTAEAVNPDPLSDKLGGA